MDALMRRLLAGVWLATSPAFNRRSRRALRRVLLALPTALWLALANPTTAHAFPAAAVATFLSWVGITGLSTTALAVATWVVNTALAIAANAVANRLLGPKSQDTGQARQASILSLTLGEAPRQAIFGEACTGGILLDAFNWGGNDKTDWEVLVIKVADHKCHSLSSFIISDTVFPFTASGVQTGFDGQLEVYWYDGDPSQAASSYLLANSPNRLYGAADWAWTSDDVCASQAYVVVAYKADDPKSSNPVWPSGRPNFKFVVKGKLCYDARKDSTVAGGSGSHLWSDPTTWEWSDNARVCDYNYDRGIYALDQIDDPTQLLIGRGLSELEAPPARVAAVANICDEAVSLLAGGTEPRYRVGCVIKADETFIKVKQSFADAMAGDIVKRDGGVEVLPGVAQSTVAEITDDDLVLGENVSWKPFLTGDERINTVIGQYVAPDQLWNTATAPIRISEADVANDGGQKVDTPSLDYVTSQTQAQRICEIRRRLARLEKRIAPVLPPIYAHLEDGDWIGWTSSRYFGGTRVALRADAYSVAASWRNSLVFREIDSSVYDWDPATDEGVPGQAPVNEFGSVDAVALTGAAFTAVLITGDAGAALPAIKATWTTPVPKAISGVRLEARKVGTTAPTVTTTHAPNDGQLTIQDGVVSQTAMEARLVPLTMDGRKVTPTAWTAVTTGANTEGADVPTANLWRKQDYAASGSAAALTPPVSFGIANWGFRFSGASAGALTVAGHTQATKGAPGYGRYSLMFQAELSAGSGSATVRAGWRTSGGAAISDLPDQLFTISTTSQRFAWDNIVSADPNFTSASFKLFTNAGDLLSSQSVDVTDLDMVYGNRSPLGFAPCPDDPEGLKLFGFTGAFDATRNKVTASATTPATPVAGDIWIVLDGLGRPLGVQSYNGASWQPGATNNVVTSSVSAPTTPTVNDVWCVLNGSGVLVAIKVWNGTAWNITADLTSQNTAAGITGQGVLATQNQVTWASQVTGVGKPADSATKNVVYYQSATPTSPTVNDIWVVLSGTTPVAIKAWNGSAWVVGADLTSQNTAAAITGQSAWATYGTKTPTSVLQFIDSTGHLTVWTALPGTNTALGMGVTMDSYPFTADSSHIYVAAFHLTGYGQSAIAVSSSTLSGLSADTSYGLVYNINSAVLGTISPDLINTFVLSPDGWVFLGVVKTQTSGGTYNTSNVQPPGYVGGGGTKFQYSYP